MEGCEFCGRVLNIFFDFFFTFIKGDLEIVEVLVLF